MELRLQNSTQIAIADLLWVAESQEEVSVILKVFGHDGQVVHNMMTAAAFDQIKETHLAERVLVDIMAK